MGIPTWLLITVPCIAAFFVLQQCYVVPLVDGRRLQAEAGQLPIDLQKEIGAIAEAYRKETERRRRLPEGKWSEASNDRFCKTDDESFSYVIGKARGYYWPSAEAVRWGALKRGEDGLHEKKLYDPWGRPFIVVYDTDQDGFVVCPDSGEKVAESLIVYSQGEDPESPEDDFKSWDASAVED